MLLQLCRWADLDHHRWNSPEHLNTCLPLPIVMGVVAASFAARCLSAADHFPTSYSLPGEIAAKWAMILVLIVIVAAMGKSCIPWSVGAGA